MLRLGEGEGKDGAAAGGSQRPGTRGERGARGHNVVDEHGDGGRRRRGADDRAPRDSLRPGATHLSPGVASSEAARGRKAGEVGELGGDQLGRVEAAEAMAPGIRRDRDQSRA